MNKEKINSVFLFMVDNLIWVFVVIALVVFSLISKSFFTPYNLVNILSRVAPLGLLVIGQSFTLITANFDLSSESTMGFTAMVAALLLASQKNGGLGLELNPYLGILIMLLVGALIGVFNGVFITRLGMNNFIMTVAMLMILRGATYAISPGKSVNFLPPEFNWLGGGSLFRIPMENGKFLAIPVSMFFVIVAFLCAYLVTKYTRFGRDMYAVGSNRQAAEAAGIDSKRVITLVYIVSGLCAALAGLLDAGRMDSATPRTGAGLIFPVQAAAVIGGISLFGGRGNLVGAFGGVLLWGILDTGLNIAKVSPFWIEVSRGALLLFAMFIDALKVRYLRRVAIRKVLASSTIGLKDPLHQVE
ncbi:ABC transporter permease [Thermanaerothrix sp.]|jgi:ribose/xylose/arabinose/galactoside ABC-type transport system permease subunit|uniref:ABC transporter permease n=1 Tax=Thermanaerothrix sp. TaxID=2972675 RepID=UPI002ADE6650|nr:ABC transporter permease [Thermanaerothrix sp.]